MRVPNFCSVSVGVLKSERDILSFSRRVFALMRFFAGQVTENCEFVYLTCRPSIISYYITNNYKLQLEIMAL